MTGNQPPLILCVDDDEAVLSTLQKVLRSDGFRTVGSTSPAQALEILRTEVPDLILLDVQMPEMDGYELCERILARPDTSHVPILFVTVLEEEAHGERVKTVGARMLLQKPVERDTLLKTVRNLVGGWPSGGKEEIPELQVQDGVWADWVRPQTFERFRGFLQARLPMGPEARKEVENAGPKDLYQLAEKLAIPPREMAEHVAQFLGVPYLATIDPEHVDLRLLTGPFCRANLVLPVREDGTISVMVSNPFDWGLQETVQRAISADLKAKVFVSEPESIRLFFTRRELLAEGSDEETDRVPRKGARSGKDDSDRALTGRAIEALSNGLLRQAIGEGASDLHLEPKADRVVARLRIDGDLAELREMSAREGEMLVARYKALGRMDIAEKRKPQDGAMEVVMAGQRRKLRLATSATPYGESMVIRILDPGSKPPALKELGLRAQQAETLQGMVQRSHGLVLVVGPTGSGKSTTIFSLLSSLEDDRRSIITVEDPVEYEMSFANQQQVNERAGATFEALLRSAVRQDPDVLLIGEIRDLFSAKAALDFASSGHLTVSTIHSSNATTAIFRLERLGVERGAMADALLGILAQKLVKLLCATCRTTRPIRDEERAWLRPFTARIPDIVAEPAGCPACRNSGYRGRAAVCELLEVDPAVAALIREGASIAKIRRFVAGRGSPLMAQHAVEMVHDFALTPEDAHRLVLVEASISEDAAEGGEGDPARESGAGSPPKKAGITAHQRPRILVAEDENDQRLLVERHLTNAGYEVTLAEDGVDALLKLGQDRFDLILSDINMPNLDGFKLLELLSQKDVAVPVVFLTARTDDEHELRGFELGARDYLRKPISKDLLRLRIARALGQPPGWTPSMGGPDQEPSPHED